LTFTILIIESLASQGSSQNKLSLLLSL